MSTLRLREIIPPPVSNSVLKSLGSIGVCTLLVRHLLTFLKSEADSWILDTPYESVKEGQDWWKTVELPDGQKEAVARTNAIRLYKLPLAK
jgi:hypothetical protein